MRVNVEDKMLRDPRFKLVGARLRMSHFEVFGRFLPVWLAALQRRSEFMSAVLVDGLAEHAGFADAMVEADLAVATDEGLRLRGVEAKLTQLHSLDQRRELANDAKAKKARPPSIPHRTSTEDVHTGHPPARPVIDQDQDLRSSSSSPELPDPGAIVRAERRPSDCATTNDARRRELWGRAWNYAATKHHELKSRGVDPTARNCWSGTPQTVEAKALTAIVADLTQGDAPDFEQAWDTIRNRIDVQVASAKAAQPPTLRWFTPAWMWKAENFAIASAMSPEQAAQPRGARAGPSAAAAPTEPRRIPTAK